MTLPHEVDIDVLCVGEALVDFISTEAVDSLSEASTFDRYQGGSPANIARNVARLGGVAYLAAKTGIGAFGQFIKRELKAGGVHTEYLVMDHRVHTSIVLISRTPGTPEFEAFRDGDFRLEPSEVRTAAVARARVIHASTFALSREPCRSAVRKAFQVGRELGRTVSLDPNYSPKIWPDRSEARRVLGEVLSLADVVKASLDDAERLFGPDQGPEDYIERYHAMGPGLVVFTMGKDGILLSHEGRVTHTPVRPVEVRDATGAGDSFWAGFLVAMLDGNDPERCVLFGREVVERKLATVGPLPDTIDRAGIYAAVEDAAGPPPG